MAEKRVNNTQRDPSKHERLRKEKKGWSLNFAPHADLRDDTHEFLKWCFHNEVPFNSVINSFLPAIMYACQNLMYVEEDTDKKYVRADFGNIYLRAGQKRKSQVVVSTRIMFPSNQYNK